jgi:membrane carboxypeptidase/penicillin-binding protein
MPELISYALGAGESTLLTMTTAYAMLANGGKKITPTMVDYIYDKHGRILYKSDDCIVDGKIHCDALFPPKLEDHRQQIIDERSMYQITSLLEGVMVRGSGAMAQSLGMTVAGKTGTSNDSRDVWFIGYTPDIAVGVFIGFDDHAKSMGRKATGSAIALPVFIDFMSNAKKYFTSKPFHIPKGIKLRSVNAETGSTSSPTAPGNVIESFKENEEEEEKLGTGDTDSIILEEAAMIEKKEQGTDIINVATKSPKRHNLSHFTNRVLDNITNERVHSDDINPDDGTPNTISSVTFHKKSLDEDNFDDDHQNTIHNHGDDDSPKVNPVFGVY